MDDPQATFDFRPWRALLALEDEFGPIMRVPVMERGENEWLLEVEFEEPLPPQSRIADVAGHQLLRWAHQNGLFDGWLKPIWERRKHWIKIEDKGGQRTSVGGRRIGR